MDIGWKVASGLAIAASGAIANALVESGWKLVTGRKPPKDDEEFDAEKLVVVAIFGAVSGMAAALLRRQAMRATAKWYGGPEKTPLIAEKQGK